MARNYYAVIEGFLVTEDIYEGGYLRYPKNSEPYCDLFKFSSQKERSTWCGDCAAARAVTLKQIKQCAHLKYQLRYMSH